MGKYAVLLSGAKAETGHDAFWNDLVLIREALLGCGFSASNIHILYGDGKDYVSDLKPSKRYRPNPAITKYAATPAKVKKVLKGLAKGNNGFHKLDSQDTLFIWTFDHGTIEDDVYCLGLHDENIMSSSEFANLVNQIPCGCRIICMQQCFSGGFIPDLENNKNIILTACKEDEIAQICDREMDVENGVTYNHGEFNYHLLSAINGRTILGQRVNVDVDSRGYVTLLSIFNYIETNDSITDECTQYNDGADSLGETVHLK